MNPYDSLGQGGYQPYKPKYNFLDVLDKKGRIKEDAQGNFIPKEYRMKWKKFMENPRGYTPATAFESILSTIPQTPNFLSSFGGVHQSNPIQALLAAGGGM